MSYDKIGYCEAHDYRDPDNNSPRPCPHCRIAELKATLVRERAERKGEIDAALVSRIETLELGLSEAGKAFSRGDNEKVRLLLCDTNARVHVDALGDPHRVCNLARPGRGDCEHAVGLPSKSIPGQHDGPDDTVDHCGIPNGWCAPCWNVHQLAKARRFGKKAAAKYNDLLASQVLRCAFCDVEYPAGTEPTQHQALTDHIATCAAHPMRALERKQAELIRLLGQAGEHTEEQGDLIDSLHQFLMADPSMWDEAGDQEVLMDLDARVKALTTTGGGELQRLRSGIEAIAEYARRNPGNGFSCGKRAEELLCPDEPKSDALKTWQAWYADEKAKGNIRSLEEIMADRHGEGHDCDECNHAREHHPRSDYEPKVNS